MHEGIMLLPYSEAKVWRVTQGAATLQPAARGRDRLRGGVVKGRQAGLREIASQLGSAGQCDGLHVPGTVIDRAVVVEIEERLVKIFRIGPPTAPPKLLKRRRGSLPEPKP